MSDCVVESEQADRPATRGYRVGGLSRGGSRLLERVLQHCQPDRRTDVGGLTDRQADRQADRRADRQADGRGADN